MAVLKDEYIIAGGVLLLIGLPLLSFKNRLINRLGAFIPSVESFSSKPYWDVTRYSWGYGTKAPGATGTISRSQAFTDMLRYLMSDYDLLLKHITRRLTVNQWAALLSFSYNLGNDDALNLVPLINAGDVQALGDKWNRYVYAGGVVNQDLVTRRAKEWDLWNS